MYGDGQRCEKPGAHQPLAVLRMMMFRDGLLHFMGVVLPGNQAVDEAYQQHSPKKGGHCGHRPGLFAKGGLQGGLGLEKDLHHGDVNHDAC